MICPLRSPGTCHLCQHSPTWRAKAGTSFPCNDDRGPDDTNKALGITAETAPSGATGHVEVPGTELKAILSSMGISESTGCQCGNMAAKMDRWGCEECGRRVAEIVDAMRQEAVRRRWPFSRTVAGALVRLAIARARKS